MAREAKNYLTDKDIRDLEIKNIKYRKTIGAPKELYIIVDPSGIKKFVIKKENGAFDSFGILKEFRSGIYSVSEARRDTNKILKDLSANRPINTAPAKWEYIDFENGVWRIPADDMKMDKAHEIALSEHWR